MAQGGGTLNIGMILALFVGIVLLIFLTGGGALKIYEISTFLKKIPVWIWVIVIIIFIFRRWGK